MLELKNINFNRDGKQILDNINLTIPSNCFYAITGPNGSGKSTLVKIIMGIEKQDSGEIFFNGKDITNLPIYERARSGISFAFQTPVRFKGLTVYDLLKMSSKEHLDKKGACSVLSEVGLCANQYINREISDKLSGGELKRIEIASVLLRESNLTIYDEPEAGIDLWSFNNLIEIFGKTAKDKNKSTIIISHQEKILKVADKVILMEEGKIKDIDVPEKIIEEATNIEKYKCLSFGGGVDGK